MKRIIRLTETDLKRIVRRVIRESGDPISDPCQKEVNALSKLIGGDKIPTVCSGADMEDECLDAIMDMVNLSDISAATTAVVNLVACRKKNSGMMY